MFNIADDDKGHYYYRDDGIPNSLSLVATTTLDDGSITDFDPDYAYTPHSWFRFDIDDTLPQLVVTDAVFIDGYSQSGASENTLAIGDDANLRIEFTSTAADNKLGFFFSGNSGGSTLQGVAINEFGSHGVVVDGGVDDVTNR